MSRPAHGETREQGEERFEHKISPTWDSTIGKITHTIEVGDWCMKNFLNQEF